MADFHGAAFEVDPQLNEGCTDALRRDFIKQLLETPECHELRASTVLNDTASEIATTAFAAQYAELHKERDKDDKEEPGKERGSGHDFGAEISVLRHVSRALSEATKGLRDEEQARLTDGAYEDAVRLLRKHRAPLDRIAAALLEKETLVRDELLEFVADVEPESRASEAVGVPRVVASESGGGS